MDNKILNGILMLIFLAIVILTAIQIDSNTNEINTLNAKVLALEERLKLEINSNDIEIKNLKEEQQKEHEEIEQKRITQYSDLYIEILNLREEIEILEDTLDSLQDKDSRAYKRDIGGEYYIDSQEILIYGAKTNDPTDLMRFSIHEIAHWFWYNELTLKQRNEFSEIHETSEAPTGYGMTNEEEDFAETIKRSTECYFNYSEINQEREDFVKKYVEEKYPLPLILQKVESDTGFSNFKIIRSEK